MSRDGGLESARKCAKSPNATANPEATTRLPGGEETVARRGRKKRMTESVPEFMPHLMPGFMPEFVPQIQRHIPIQLAE